ncbi:MAG: aminotransferase class V-fold PLP-dependent enzyme [Pirellulaceae bacterium]|jgi:glutamate/tyrosine decarboxylase-like PLP-dependent enzyme|nr:aminotransferase class V-fold PLP-dependent enzyme [Pirellulaceae bacterium]MDP7017723.1 aminotransferase class V-fold PLP-dependent enzyme [Pirellulaceae bacterium]
MPTEDQAAKRDDTRRRPALDPDADAMRQFGYALVDRLVDHLTTMSDQPVARRGTGADFSALVDEPLPAGAASLDDCLGFFFDRVAPGMTRVAHPRFHAYIPCPSSFAGMVGEMLAAGTNPFVGTWLGGATVSALELTVLRWLGEMLGYDPAAGGILTSGGSMANLIAIASARARYGPEVMQRGVIYLSREGHASVNKAARILGFQQAAIRTVGVDDDFRMDLEQLAGAVRTDRSNGALPFFVSANAGTTNSGAIDPLSDIADHCVAEDLWFHVDGAYGGFAALTPEGRELLDGMERADSLTLDPHKWLYCPMGVGCVLVREKRNLEAAFSADGHYLRDLPVDEVNFMDRGPELSRPGRALSVWMVIRSAGRDMLSTQIAEDMRLARLAADLLGEDDRLEVRGVGLSVVTFCHRLRPGESEAERAERDDALMEATLLEGELMLSTTLLGGRNTLRLVVMNHRTTEAELRRTIAGILKHAS